MVFVSINMPTTVSVSTLSPEYFLNECLKLKAAFDEGVNIAAHRGWNEVVVPMLTQHWRMILMSLAIAFLFALFDAYVLKNWRSLGSLIYRTLFFSIVLALGFIVGPEFLAGDGFHLLCIIIVYKLCYKITGRILNQMGFYKMGRSW